MYFLCSQRNWGITGFSSYRIRLPHVTLLCRTFASAESHLKFSNMFFGWLILFSLTAPCKSSVAYFQNRGNCRKLNLSLCLYKIKPKSNCACNSCMLIPSKQLGWIKFTVLPRTWILSHSYPSITKASINSVSLLMLPWLCEQKLRLVGSCLQWSWP